MRKKIEFAILLILAIILILSFIPNFIPPDENCVASVQSDGTEYQSWKFWVDSDIECRI